MAHTPGPWLVSHASDCFDNVVRAGDAKCGIVIAVITRTPCEKANVNLIAAAPTMLEALQETLDELEALRDALPHPRSTGESAVCHRARHAIALATEGK